MLSFTFDDGTKDHLRIAAPELEKHLWRGTFFINTRSNDRPAASLLSRKEILELARRGHEIGAHTMTHRSLDALEAKKDYPSTAWELAENIKSLEDITGKTVRTYTAPFGENPPFALEILAQKNILNTPPRLGIGGNSIPETLKQHKDAFTAQDAFTVICAHGVAPGYGGWAAPDSKSAFTEMLDFFAELENDIWFDTFENNGYYRLRQEHSQIIEKADGMYMVKLDTAYSNAYGRLFLKSHAAGREVIVNGLPLLLEESTGLFTAYPGDVLQLPE